jgi:hypothetical protein
LLAAFDGPLQIVAFEQGVIETPRPAVVQRLCAVRVVDDDGAGDTLWPLESGAK